MTDLRRLLAFVRPYWSPLTLSVLLMAVAGASHAMMAVLIKPIFDRVLDPASPDGPVEIIKLPIWNTPIYLHHLAPPGFSNVWSIVAFAIVTVFLIRGLCDYFGNYLVNWVGINAVTDIRQKVFDKLLRHDSQFFESNATGRIMSSVMSDIDKIQMATSSMLADWLRQSFSAAALLYVVLQRDWRLAVVSLTVLPIVLVPTVRIGKRIRRTTRKAQDNAAELNEILQEAMVGQQVVKAFTSEKHESARFHAAAWKLRNANLRYVAQQAVASPADRVLRRAHHRRPPHLRSYADQSRQPHSRRVHQLRDCAVHAVRARQAPHRHSRHFPARDGRGPEGLRIPRLAGSNREPPGGESAHRVSPTHRVSERAAPVPDLRKLRPRRRGSNR
jgi:subfamily B ATP-binding cassette protein MsbA